MSKRHVSLSTAVSTNEILNRGAFYMWNGQCRYCYYTEPIIKGVDVCDLDLVSQYPN